MVYLFLAYGFEECEALVPLDILRRGDIEVKTVGIGKEFICGAHNITVKADLTEKDVLLDSELSCVILPGGMPGTLNLKNSETVIKTLGFAKENNLLICAICAAPMILGNLGYLQNKKATCFPDFEKELIGAEIQNAGVVKDGKFITAKGAGAASDFGFEILSTLKNKQTADNLKLQMQYSAEV